MAPIATSQRSPDTPILPPLKATKPLLRRSTLSGTVRTRDDAGLDLDDSSMSTPPSPSKRARTVTFSPVVQEQILPVVSTGWSFENSIETVQIDVRSALDDHIRGASDTAYDAIRENFRKPTRHGGGESGGASNEDMKMNLLALTSCVSLLGKSCNGLVQTVLDCEWAGRDEGFIKVYVHFLGNLASAQGSYMGSILNMIVGKFAGIRLASGRLPDCPVVNSQQLSTRVHMALRYLLRLIPSSSGILASVVSTRFPYSDESKRAHLTYIKNLTQLIEYAPELRSDIYALMTDRLVKIDVQMQVDLDDLDDEVAAAIVHGISVQPGRIADAEDDEVEDSGSDSDSVTSDDMDDEDHKRVKEVQSKVEKMDAILDTLFTLYSPCFTDPESNVAKDTFNTLLAHFRNIILPTYRSRHTQFLLFHFAQKSDHLVDEFAGECVDLAFKSGRPAVFKQSAAAYLASFVSRGAHVLTHTVREVFEYMGAALDKIRLENENGCRGPDLNRYGTFYATTQALIYIFCFRWRDLINEDEDEPIEDDEDYLTRDLEWLPGIKELMARTIYSKLNPLRVCAPSIVEEFAKIAHLLRFMYVYPLLETNKRVRLSQFALKVAAIRDTNHGGAQGGDEDSWSQMDAYFPFDPYQLPVSRRWLEGDYVAWKGLPGHVIADDDDESSEADDDDEDGSEGEEDEDTATEEDN